MAEIDLTAEEKVIMEAILDARKVQEFLWGDLSLSHYQYNAEVWAAVFQKRCDKIKQIHFGHPNAKVELRKRILQQACLSIKALMVLKDEN